MLKLSPALAHRMIEGQAFVLDPRRKVLHSLNGTGSEIWKGLSAGRSPEQIAESVAAAFDVGSDAALADVRAFIEALRAKGLLIDA